MAADTKQAQPAERKSASLTERRIRDAKPGPKQVILWDREVKGLGVRIAPGGTKAFILNYRVNGRERRATLGRCSEISLREARERAGVELIRVRDGDDPLRRRQKAAAAPTVNEGLDRFFGEYVPRRIADGRMGQRTAYDYEKQANRTIRPALGKLKIAEVARHDIERAVDKRGPIQRNRTLSLLRRLFNLFETWEYRPQHTNPVRGIERAREVPRDRVFSPTEIGLLAEAVDDIVDPFVASALRFLMVTGWRNGEALAMRWEHIDFERGEITLPSTKTGRDVRPVAGLALQAVANLPRINGNPFVFAGSYGAAVGYKRLAQEFRGACEAAGIENARLHDIRRSVATTAAAHGVSVLMLRDLLGHKTTAMANRYARRAGSALQETQDAVADRMSAMMAGKGAEIVRLKR